MAEKCQKMKCLLPLLTLMVLALNIVLLMDKFAPKVSVLHQLLFEYMGNKSTQRVYDACGSMHKDSVIVILLPKTKSP